LFGFDLIASLHIEYPMLFELHNGATDRISHCGVLEFVAEEGMIIMPYWVWAISGTSFTALFSCITREIYSN
jgi:hypothetical protein